MSSNVGKKNIAHKGSGHGCVAPAAMSLVTPPAPPAPTPFPYTARAGNASDTESSLKVSGNEVLVEGSTMSLDPPANQPAQSGGGDVVTHATKNIAVMTMGSFCLTAGGKGVCATADIAALNVITKQSKVAQMSLPLLEAGDFEMASKSSAAAAAMNEKYKRAWPPQKANQCPGGHPVDLGTGYVIDEAVDLRLPGHIPLVWSRTYTSAGCRMKGALGKGGWFHSFEPWIEPTDEGLRYHDPDGSPVELGVVAEGEVGFHRGQRLEIRRHGRSFEIRSLQDRLIRTFAPLPGGRVALRSIRDSRDHRIELHYEGDVLVGITDSVKRRLRVFSDDQGRVTRVEVWASEPGSAEPPSLQTWFEYGYHPEGELAHHLDALGHAEGWEYDGLHRMVKATLRNGVSFHYEYDPELGHCVRTWGDGGLHDVRLEIDFEKGETRTHGTNRARRYRWKNGVVVREETFGGEWAEERVYDEDEICIAKKNGAGEETKFEFDARGNLVAQTDPAGNVVRWVHHDDLPISKIDPLGHETRYSYDEHGALTGIAFPTGAVYRFDVDREGLLAAIYDRDGARARLEHDAHGNLIRETSGHDGGRPPMPPGPAGRRAVTTYRYDALGRVVEKTDPLGRKSRAVWDAVGHVLEIVRPDGERVKATYDRLGLLASATDPLGQVTRFEHAGTGRIARLIQADGQVYRFVHDSDERLTRILNPRLEAYEYEWDRADRVVGERTFDGRAISYRYDRAGRITRVDHPEGEWRELRHDKLGKVLEDRGSDVQITYVRDQLGRIEKAVCQDVTGKVVTELERDGYGRLTADIQNGRAVRYEYDDRGRRAARVLPDGERTQYHYDLDDEIAGVTHDGERLVIERDALGRERRRTLGSWALEVEYDAVDRVLAQKVTSLAAAGSPSVVVERRYGYDALGRLTSIDSAHDGLTTYRYDVVSQLLQATRGGVAEVFEYDPAGSLVSRLAELDGPSKRPWTMGPGNRLKATEDARYVNDDRGRRIQRIEGERTTTYGWDTKDRLREVVNPDGTRVRFTYDALGRRVRKDVLGPADAAAIVTGAQKQVDRRTVTFLWDGFELCEENDTGKPEARRKRVHVHKPGSFLPLLQIEAGQVFGVITDHLGTPKELVDRAGRVAWRAEHGAWGDVQRVTRDPGTPEVESPFRLLGQYADAETGLASTLFRCFEPRTARWLSPDPLGARGGPNLSGFNAAPTLRTDALGLVTCVERMQDLADQAYQKLINDPDAVRAHLTPDELAAAAKEPWLRRVFFGTAMERELDQAVLTDPLMRRWGITGRSGSGPDYESTSGRTFELTTDNPGTVAAHEARPNAADHIITYPSLTNDQVFGNKSTGAQPVF